MWVLVQYEYEKFFKRRWMASTMCIVWKSQRINISQKKWDERLVFYKNVYGTVIKSILTDIDENEKKLSMVMDLLTAFFPFTKRLSFHDTYQVVVFLFCSYFIKDMF